MHFSVRVKSADRSVPTNGFCNFLDFPGDAIEDESGQRAVCLSFALALRASQTGPDRSSESPESSQMIRRSERLENYAIAIQYEP